VLTQEEVEQRLQRFSTQMKGQADETD
jgi:hypothetical protein